MVKFSEVNYDSCPPPTRAGAAGVETGSVQGLIEARLLF